jgi:ATP-dependent helicase/nuclease subunit A
VDNPTGRTEIYNDEQRKAIFSEEPLVVISAGAGSGKTKVLTERFVHLCEQSLDEHLNRQVIAKAATVDQIVAITFTKKAAREMRDRIRQAMEKRIEAAREEQLPERDLVISFWEEQLDSLGNAIISTFHSFCQKLIQNYAYEAEVFPAFHVLDEVSAKLMQFEILDKLLGEEAAYRTWRGLHSFFNPDSLKKAIVSIYAEANELSGTIDWDTFLEPDVLLSQQQNLVLERKASLLAAFYHQIPQYLGDFRELSGKNSEAGKTAGKLLDYFESLPATLAPSTEWYSVLREVVPSLQGKGSWKKSAPRLYEFIKEEFDPLKHFWSASPDLSEEDLAEQSQILGMLRDILKEFHIRYEQTKREQMVMDFTDLQQKAVSLLANPVIAEDCRKKYRHFMVDEFQDTNPLQMKMLELVQPLYRFIVGDGKQSIYRFRGADVSLMKQYMSEAKARESDQAYIDLYRNYRTCDGIIRFVNAAFQAIMGAEESDLPYQIHYSRLEAHRNGEEEQKTRVELLRVVPSKSEDEDEQTDEYEFIASRIYQMVNGNETLVMKEGAWQAPEWRDVAILIPSRTGLTQLESALKNYEIPYVVYGGIGFYEKQEVLDMVSLLHWLNRPWEPLYILALLRGPLFGLDINDFVAIYQKMDGQIDLAEFLYQQYYKHQSSFEPTLTAKLDAFLAFYQKHVPFRSHLNMKEALLQLFEESGLRLICLLQENSLQKIKNVEKLISVLADFGCHSFEQMLKQLKRLIDLSEKEGEAEVELDEGNAVHVMTVHASKGLEFPVVFSPNLSRSVRADSGSIRFHREYRLLIHYVQNGKEYPHEQVDRKSPLFDWVHQQIRDEALEESKRLFYVAATRARDYLVLSAIHKEKSRDDAEDKTWYQMLLSAWNILEEQELIRVQENLGETQKDSKTMHRYPGPVRSLGRVPMYTFSVSEIMEFMQNPLSYYEKYILRIDPSWLEHGPMEGSYSLSGGSGLDSLALGTLVHQACEWMDRGIPVEQALSSALDLLDEEAEYQKEKYAAQLVQLIDGYRSVDPSVFGETFENEWSFAFELEGAWIIGTIDKISKTEHGYHLIDFKTNRINQLEKLIAKYKPQLYLYKLAFEQLKQEKVSNMSLLFLRAKQEGLMNVPYDPVFEQRIRAAVRNMSELKQRGASRAEYAAFTAKD